MVDMVGRVMLFTGPALARLLSRGLCWKGCVFVGNCLSLITTKPNIAGTTNPKLWLALNVSHTFINHANSSYALLFYTPDGSPVGAYLRGFSGDLPGNEGRMTVTPVDEIAARGVVRCVGCLRGVCSEEQEHPRTSQNEGVDSFSGVALCTIYKRF